MHTVHTHRAAGALLGTSTKSIVMMFAKLFPANKATLANWCAQAPPPVANPLGMHSKIRGPSVNP